MSSGRHEKDCKRRGEMSCVLREERHIGRSVQKLPRPKPPVEAFVAGRSEVVKGRSQFQSSLGDGIHGARK